MEIQNSEKVFISNGKEIVHVHTTTPSPVRTVFERSLTFYMMYDVFFTISIKFPLLALLQTRVVMKDLQKRTPSQCAYSTYICPSKSSRFIGIFNAINVSHGQKRY